MADATEPRHLRQARYLGADAALAAASWAEMSEDDARSILDDVDPEVLDRYREPNLSGEYADDPTPASIAREVGANDGDIAFYGADLLDDIATAWEDGRDRVWGDALQGVALRTLGRIDDAVRVERGCEAEADRLREHAEAETDDTIAATANGWCCVDCLMLLANGETPPELSEAETAEYLARVEGAGDASRVTLGRRFGADGCEHGRDDAEAHAEDCESLTFSWRACDVCGSTLGGERHAVTFWLAEVGS